MIKLLKKLFCVYKDPTTAPLVEKIRECMSVGDFKSRLIEVAEKGLLEGDNPKLKISYELYAQVEDFIGYCPPAHTHDRGSYSFCGKSIELEAVPSSESQI